MTDVIRDVEFLPIGDSSKNLARQLINEIDMQVIFWINSDLEYNVSCRHNEQQNQFWVTVKPQVEQQEFERLILAGLCRGVQERKRYQRIWWNVEYVQNLKNVEHIDTYVQFLNFIQSFVTSLITEMFLSRHNIFTSEKVKQEKFRHRISLLDEYIQKRQKRSRFVFCWYRETEVYNLIECGNFWRWGYAYQKELKKYLPKINKEYLSIVEKVAYKIEAIMAAYNGENGGELTEEIQRYIRDTFKLEMLFYYYTPLAKKEKIQFKDGQSAVMLSFIPEDFPQQELLIRWNRISSECISLIREIEQYETPDVTFCLIKSERCNEYANVADDGSAFINYTTAHVSHVYNYLKEYDIYATGDAFLITRMGEDAYRKQLFRFIVYFMAAHEYAHILNGDCIKGKGEVFNKEINADNKAEGLLEKIIPFQYRFENEFSVQLMKKFFETYAQDRLIVYDAIRFVEKYRESIVKEALS